MFGTKSKETVKKLTDIPQSSVGAPIPAVIAGEHSVAVVFYAEIMDPDWDGSYVRVVDSSSDNKPSVIVRFSPCFAHYFGPPNDEAFSGHPLYSHGVKPYANFEVENSSWLSSLEKMNSVHPYHNKSHFLSDKKHFILAFHDSTFECIATGYTVEQTKGSIRELLSKLSEEIE